MKCHYCGADLVDGELYCRCCGTRRDRREETAITEEKIEIPAEFSEPAPRPQRGETTGSGHFEDFCPEPVIPQAKPANRPAYVPYGAPERKSPMLQLPAERGLAKMFFLGILTLGIYPLVIWCRIVTELNIAASRYDGERTMSYLGMVLLAPITLCIYPLVWFHGFCRRIGTELKRRGINYEFGASTFWLWNVLGTLILVGPFIFVHKLMRAMNLLNRDFNVKG